MNLTDRQKGLAFASISALLWAVLPLFLKYSLNFAKSGTIVWVRMVLAFTFTLLFLSFKFKPSEISEFVKSKSFFLSGAAGLFLALNYFGYMQGLDYSSASFAQILIQSGPLMLATIGVFYFKEKLSALQISGLILALIGFSLFYLDQSQSYQATSFKLAIIWLFIGGFTWALYASFQKQLTQTIHPQFMNLAVFFIASMALLAMADFSDFKNLNLQQFLIYLFLGFNTFAAYGALAEALKRAPAAQVSLIIALNPLLTILIIQVTHKLNLLPIPPEPISAIGIAGVTCVVLGVILTVKKKKARV